MPRRGDPPSTEPAITVPERGAPETPGVTSVPPEHRAPTPPIADERPNPPSGVEPPAGGDPLASKPTDPIELRTAKACALIALDVLRRYGVQVPAVAHAAMIDGFAAYVKGPGKL